MHQFKIYNFSEIETNENSKYTQNKTTFYFLIALKPKYSEITQTGFAVGRWFKLREYLVQYLYHGFKIL